MKFAQMLNARAKRAKLQFFIVKYANLMPILFQALSRDQVVAVHIDNGFMRKNESRQVEESLKRLGVKLKGTFAEDTL